MRYKIRLRHGLVPSLALIQVLAAGCFPEIKPPVITGKFTLRGSSTTSVAPVTVEQYSSLSGSRVVDITPDPTHENMISAADGSCEGIGGYSDIKPGKPVIVYNQSDTIIGNGELSAGRVGTSQTRTSVIPASDDSAGDLTIRSSEARLALKTDKDCTFSFRITTNAPATFYRIEVANRGKLTYSAKDLAAINHSVSLEIGN